jgi:hypothetical protein
MCLKVLPLFVLLLAVTVAWLWQHKAFVQPPQSADLTGFPTPIPWPVFEFAPKIANFLVDLQKSNMPPVFRVLDDATAFFRSQRVRIFVSVPHPGLHESNPTKNSKTNCCKWVSKPS